jgi:hypothetical protein
MCVIIVGTATKKPTEQQLRDCWARNPHGAGVATTVGGRVMWRKGIHTVEELIEAVAGFSGPWIAHVRYTTVGGNHDILHHPFPVDAKAPKTTSGLTETPVLFHNGTWREWEKGLRDLLLSHDGVKAPAKPMSDSRAISIICAVKGADFLHLLPGRFAVLSGDGKVRMFPTKKRTTGTSRWFEVDGVWYSNMDWRNLIARDGSHGKRVQYSSRWPEPNDYNQTCTTDPGEEPTRPTLGSHSAKRRGSRTATKTSGEPIWGNTWARARKRTEPQPDNPRKLGQVE